MIDLSKFLDIAGNLIELGIAIGTVISLFNRLEKRITALSYHLESHCQILQHISSHLESETDYEPIHKPPIR